MLNKYFAIYMLLIFCSLSCVRLQESEPVQDLDLEYVDVCLNLKQQAELSCKLDASPSPAAVLDEEIIDNFWVLQFDGTDDAALIVGERQYFSNYSDSQQIKLVSSDVPNTIVVLANTFDSSWDFSQTYTLGEMKTRLRSISGEQDLFVTSGDVDYIPFSGYDQKTIFQGVQIEIDLYRTIAKLNVKIVNSSKDVTIKSWQLRSLPELSYYFNSYALDDSQPLPSLDKLETTIDYPLVTLASSLAPALVGQEAPSVDFTAYLPANKRGTVSEVSNDAYKNRYAPYASSYLQINAVSDGEPIVYKFYLGGNMSTDFNILPNSSYTYVFDISSKGDPEFDSRVNMPCLVDYSNPNDELANCYIINPFKQGDVTRRFRIPVKRVDEFWGGKSGYENVPANTLGNSVEWYVEVIASNFDHANAIRFSNGGQGTGSYDMQTRKATYFEFTVEPELQGKQTKGNAIVALRRRSDDRILWSWHLWITDYCPQQAFDKTPIPGVYNYPVDGCEGSAIHRYEGGLWSDEYAGRFIMDRNLGALGLDYVHSGDGALYYQFGRKDPLFGNTATGYSSQGFRTVNYTEAQASEPGEPTATVRYSIYNPLHCIYRTGRGAWTEGNKYNPDVFDETILWQDPKTSSKKYPGSAQAKSIFDPCPPGYCVPKIGTWGGFTRNDSPNPTTNIRNGGNMLRGFLPYYATLEDGSSKYGGHYWPGTGQVPSFDAYYPSSGYKDQANPSGPEYLYSLSATPYSETNASGMTMSYYSDQRVYNLDPAYTLARNLALPVRCITVRD